MILHLTARLFLEDIKKDTDMRIPKDDQYGYFYRVYSTDGLLDSGVEDEESALRHFALLIKKQAARKHVETICVSSKHSQMIVPVIMEEWECDLFRDSVAAYTEEEAIAIMLSEIECSGATKIKRK